MTAPTEEDPSPPPAAPGSPTATAAEAEPPTTGSFTWEVSHFSAIREKKIYSDTFEAGGMPWRILVFPHGNSQNANRDVSIYLDVADAKNLDRGWHRHAQFTLRVLHHGNKDKSFWRDAQHVFTADESDWGFTQFMSYQQLTDESNGFIMDDSITIEATVNVLKDLPSSYGTSWVSYDSKKETGFVGLKNQGATCYMNSLLQALFLTGEFRRAVYQMPTVGETPQKSIPLALQRVFYGLQNSAQSVATKELTKSFGWDTYDSFTQHDVQELARVLCDNLEEKMKGTAAEGSVAKLFEGTVFNYIQCINIDFKSSREESFYDLQLGVKGCQDIYASFEKYCEEETLEGDNKYMAEGHGLQDARKGVKFKRFPPVLHLQLKRFEYDPIRDATVKINDRYVFPPEINLDKYLTDDAPRDVPNTYALQGVLVHSGDVHGGHYYAFFRPNIDKESGWFKFDDERVTKAKDEHVYEENFGGEDDYSYMMGGKKVTSMHKKFTNAYMLVYVRVSDAPRILRTTTDMDIPEDLRGRLEADRDADEKRRKEKAEAHLYITLKVALDKDLAQHRGNDLVNFEKVQSFKVLKTSSIKDFKATAEKSFGIESDRQRYWQWVNRQNKTFRPDMPLTPREEAMPLFDTFKHMPDAKIYLEVLPEQAPTHTDDDAFISFKFLDAHKRLRYVGSLVVAVHKPVSQVLPRLCELAKLPANTPLDVYEEIKPTMIEPVSLASDLISAELSNGDILAFQVALDHPLAKAEPKDKDAAEGDGEAESNPELDLVKTVPEYYDYIYNRVKVQFRKLEKPKEDDFEIELSKQMSYEQVTERLGAHLGLDPLKIRLTAHNSYQEMPKPTPIKRDERLTLHEMLSHHYLHAVDILYYEKLDVSITDLENKRKIKVSFFSASVEEVKTVSLLMAMDATMGEVAEQLAKQVPLAGSREIRIMEVWNHKITKVFEADSQISMASDMMPLRAEEIPDEELNLGDDQKVVNVVHFSNLQPIIQHFGEPFRFVISSGETVADAKQRIQAKLGIADAAFAKWKIAKVTFGRAEPLEDDAVLADIEFQESADALGLEHAAPKNSSTYRSTFDKPIKIYN